MDYTDRPGKKFPTSLGLTDAGPSFVETSPAFAPGSPLTGYGAASPDFARNLRCRATQYRQADGCESPTDTCNSLLQHVLPPLDNPGAERQEAKPHGPEPEDGAHQGGNLAHQPQQGAF